MLLKSHWLPARIPFTVLMLPLFWLMMMLSPNLHETRSLTVLLIVHGLLYGAANGYLSFYGATHRPGFPVASRAASVRLYAAIGLHAAAILVGYFNVNLDFACLVLVYGSIAYAYGISFTARKEPAFITWATIRTAQGILAAVAYYVGLNNFPVESALTVKVLIPGLVATLLLAAYFPAPYFSSTNKFLLGSALLVLAGALSVWFFITRVSTAYITGLLVAFAAAWAILWISHAAAHRQKEMPLLRAPRTLWISWLATLAANAYAFYLLLDFTQLGQLLQ